MKTKMILCSLLVLLASSPAQSFSVINISDTTNRITYPNISDNVIIWAEMKNGTWGIYSYSWGDCLDDGAYHTLVADMQFGHNTEPSPYRPSIHGDTVVWEADPHSNDQWEVRGKILSTGEEITICTKGWREQYVSIFGDTVIWQDHRSSSWEIFYTDLSDTHPFPHPGSLLSPLGSDNHYADIHEDFVVYSDPQGIFGAYVEGESFSIISGVNNWLPSVHGNTVVWQSKQNGNWDIFAAKINGNTAEIHQIITHPAEQRGPDVYGDVIVWRDNRNGNWDVYGADISDIHNPVEFQITSSPAHEGGRPEQHNGPRIQGNVVTFMAEMGSGWNNVACELIPCNTPPVAVCQNIQVPADDNCQATVPPEAVGGQSYDPDEDPIIMMLTPSGPYVLGQTNVTLTVSDDKGESDSCSATITVVDQTPPTLFAQAGPLTLWPPNHKYVAITAASLVDSVWDNCSNLAPQNVIIAGVESDEPEDAKGNGDGKTKNDILINSQGDSVSLRAERQGKGNGRVYTVYLLVQDNAGNENWATAYVYVPHNKHSTALDDGPAYCEMNMSLPPSP